MGKSTDLEAFICAKAQSSATGEPEINWEERKTEWLKKIGSLYAGIRKWLARLEQKGVVRFLTSPIRLEEDPIGTYEVEVLSLLIGKQRVAFYPKGTAIVGATGRIDIRGPRGIRTIILTDGRWQIVERAPKLKAVPFDEHSFQNVLSEVME